MGRPFQRGETQQRFFGIPPRLTLIVCRKILESLTGLSHKPGVGRAGPMHCVPNLAKGGSCQPADIAVLVVDAGRQERHGQGITEFTGEPDGTGAGFDARDFGKPLRQRLDNVRGVKSTQRGKGRPSLLP